MWNSLFQYHFNVGRAGVTASLINVIFWRFSGKLRPASDGCGSRDTHNGLFFLRTPSSLVARLKNEKT